MFEFTTILAGGRDHKEMGEAVASAMEQTCAEGWEPISFTPVGFRFILPDTGGPQSNNLLDYRLITTAQQIVFRRQV